MTYSETSLSLAARVTEIRPFSLPAIGSTSTNATETGAFTGTPRSMIFAPTAIAASPSLFFANAKR